MTKRSRLGVGTMGAILVIDDDIPLQETLTDMFEDDGHEVRCNIDLEALIWAREGWPDVILLDVNLPYLQGMGFWDYLRNHPATRCIPVVFMTGVGEVNQHSRWLRVFDVVMKPFELDHLTTVVAQALEQDWKAHTECLHEYHNPAYMHGSCDISSAVAVGA